MTPKPTTIKPKYSNDYPDDLTGEKFGRLTVIKRGPTAPDSNRGKRWLCRCDCGKEKIIHARSLKRGITKSCGCYWKELALIGLGFKHGHTSGLRKTSEYTIWASAKSRCFNPKDRAYKRYGGRGIVMCAEWSNSFEAFFAYVGPRPAGLSIDRIDNNGNYEPGNVHWATRKEQSRNGRHNHFLTYKNETHTIAEWAEKLSIKQSTLRVRLFKHWPIERALGGTEH